MNKNLFYIYCLIILESRISLETAGKLFNLSKKELKSYISYDYLTLDLIKAIDFCEYENNLGLINQNKSMFKARLLYDKFLKILRSENKKEELSKFISDLEGHEKIKEFYTKSTISWTEEEKEIFFKYKLKYALDNNKFRQEYSTQRRAVGQWIKDYPEGEIKNRLLALNEYSFHTYNRINRIRKYDKKYDR